MNEAELAQNLCDPMWRINNLYSIMPREGGGKIPFSPFSYQEQFNSRIFKDKQKKHIIVKPRRMGFSTDIGIVMLDQSIFGGDSQFSILDLTAGDAQEKLESKIKFGWENLDNYNPELKEAYDIRLTKDNAGQLQWSNNATIHAGMNARGGTNHLLHISEWGVLLYESGGFKRSKRIRSGALPSADDGVVVVETTWMGGKQGHLWELVEEALSVPDHLKTEKDWHFHFPSWADDPRNRLEGDTNRITQEVMDYLIAREKELGRTFTDTQKMWYFINRQTYKEDMTEEYPTTADEAFSKAVEGAIYAKEMGVAEIDGRICDFNADSGAATYTTWDIGSPKNTCVTYWQKIGLKWRVIDYDEGLDLNVGERVSHMKAKGYHYACHLLPHDAESKSPAGFSFKEELENAGLHGVKIIPRTTDVWLRINRMREMFANIWFNKEKAESLIFSLQNYRQRKNETAGFITSEIVHDQFSHGADSFSYLAEAEQAGLLIDGDRRRKVASEQSRRAITGRGAGMRLGSRGRIR